MTGELARIAIVIQDATIADQGHGQTGGLASIQTGQWQRVKHLYDDYGG